MEEHIGTRLLLEGKKTLTIGQTELEFNDPAAQKSYRSSSCNPFVSGAPSNSSIPLYNILWASSSEGSVTIEYAERTSKTKLSLRTSQFAVACQDEQNEDDNRKAVTAQAFAEAVLDRAYEKAQRRKRAYILINPKSGPGVAERRWREEVKPLFEAACMKFDVVVLGRGGEATDLAEKVDLDKYDVIVACSGDGTPHEIFNGLAKRPDARTALSSIAVCHVPCGSGNAMACNLYGSSHASFAALGIIKGVVTPLDLISITQGDRRIISFLSQSLGIIAESDLGTEHLRWMGGTRFEVGLAVRLFQKKCYPCDLAVKVEVDGKTEVKAHYKRLVGDVSLDKLDSSSDVTGFDYDGLPKLKYGTVMNDLPDGWQLVSYDKIGNFYCGNMAYMAPYANFFTAAFASDGCMDLVLVNGDIPLPSAIKTIMDVESGKFFDNPNVTYKKISAYRVIPRNQEDGYISIDGERIPFEPFQAEVHQGLGRVISKKGVYEAAGPANWDKVTLLDRVHA